MSIDQNWGEALYKSAILLKSGQKGETILRTIQDSRPSVLTVSQDTKFLNGTSSDLSINGSVTPVVFTAAPSAGQVWYVDHISIVIDSSGTADLLDFGSITGLTNGLLVETVVSGTAYTNINIKRNADIAAIFIDGNLRGTASGFLNSNNAYVGKHQLLPLQTLVGANGDLMRVTVRDDLSAAALSFLEMELGYHRVIGAKGAVE